MQRKPLSIYIHIPFCNSKCHYCAFNSCVASDITKDNYVSALLKEISLRSKEYGAGRIVNTIYIGGGTPSCLPTNAVLEIIKAINSGFVVSDDAEITIEMNPNTITKEKLNEYRLASINRFSVGLQAVQPNLLKILGRTHTAQDYLNAVDLMKQAGCTNFSTDLMLGLPTQTSLDALKTVDTIISSGATHISCYMLEIEEGTNFHKLYEAGMLNPANEEETIKMYNMVYDKLKKAGFVRYEVSNFAKVGFESKHNKNYWKRGDYLGIGLSAHSFVSGIRFSNTDKLGEYINHLSKNEIPLEYKEAVTSEETIEEMIMLGLRTTSGVNLDKLKEVEGGKEWLNQRMDSIRGLIKDGFLILTPDSNLICTDKGFLVLDKLIETII